MTFDTAVAAKAVAEETELYEIYFPGHTEYYSSGSRDVTIPALSTLNPTASPITYLSAPITRDRFKSSQKVGPRTTRVLLPVKTNFQKPVLDGGLGNIEVKIMRGFGDPATNPERFVRYWYTGLVNELEISSNLMSVKLETLESLLDKIKVPRPRVATSCQYQLYSTGSPAGMCDLDEADYTYAFTVDSITDEGRSAICVPDNLAASKAEFGDNNLEGELSSGYYTLGKLWREDDLNQLYPVMIQAHTWDSGTSTVKFSFHTPVLDLNANPPDNRILASWGCDKRYITCRDKFNNTDNAFMFNRLPNKNPILYESYNK